MNRHKNPSACFAELIEALILGFYQLLNQLFQKCEVIY